MKQIESSGGVAPPATNQGEHKPSDSDLPNADSLLLPSIALDALSQAICIVDEAGMIAYANASHRLLFGDSPVGPVRRPLFGLTTYSAADSTRRLNDIRQHLQSAPVWQAEWLCRRSDGTQFCSRIRISALATQGREFWLCTNTQILGDSLRDLADVRLAAIIESSDDAIITKDLNGIITTWNRAAERIFGYTAAEAVGKPIAMLAVPERLNEMPDILQRLQRGLRIDHFETERRTKDGRTISVSLTVSPVRSPSGDIVGASKIARDITESKRLRLELAEREQHYAVLLANLPDVVTRVGPDLRIIFVSQAVQRVTGLSAESLLGKTHAQAGWPVDLATTIQTKLEQLFALGQTQTLEFKLMDPAGELRDYFATLVPEYFNGQIASALIITRDVTEQTRALSNQLAVERELMLLVEASSALIASPQSKDVLRTILRLAQRFIAADAHAVWREQGGQWRLLTSSGLSEEYKAVSVPGDQIAPIKDAVMFEDVHASPALSGRAASYTREGIRSMLVVPLWIHAGFTGTVVYYWKARRSSSPADVRIASALGNLAAAALGTADLYEEETRSRHRAEWSETRSKFLARAGALLSSSLDFAVTLKTVAELAVPEFADWCSVDVVDERGKVQRVATHHWNAQMLQVAKEYASRFPQRENDLSQVALRTGRSVLVEEITPAMVAESSRGPEHADFIRRLNLHSVIVAPMVLGDQILGIITFVSAESGRRFTAQDLELAEELARRAATAIAHARLYDHVRESEERLRIAVGAAELGVWEIDLETGAMTCSDQCKRNVGFAPDEETTYAALEQRINPADLTRWKGTVDVAVESRTTFEVEYRVLTANGSEQWIVAYGRAVYTPDGLPSRLLGVTLNVTEKRNLLLREQDARRTAELLNAVGPILLSELDPRRLVQSIIDLATELVGAMYGALFYNSEKNDPSSLLYSFAGIDTAAFEELPAAQRADLIALWLSYSGILRLDNLAGQSAPSPFSGLTKTPVRSYLAIPIRSRSGEVLGALVFGHGGAGVFNHRHEEILTGIAAQAAIALENARLFDTAKQTGEALLKSNQELRRANEDLNQFAYSASHDLQEPLRMVAIYSQMLKRRYSSQLDEKGLEYLGFAVQGAQRMELLVKDLLAYTQAGEIGQEHAGAADADKGLAQALLNLQSSMDASGASVVSENLPPVQVTEIHLVQLFQNLIGNALKYRQADIAPRISIEHLTHQGWVEFLVRDNGIGIPVQYHKQIFGIFKRLHSGDKYTGTGIGLAICQRIVERYQGRIWVDSREGEGSTFHFTLPAARL